MTHEEIESNPDASPENLLRTLEEQRKKGGVETDLLRQLLAAIRNDEISANSLSVELFDLVDYIRLDDENELKTDQYTQLQHKPFGADLIQHEEKRISNLRNGTGRSLAKLFRFW